jgi:uncharacterized protein (TIGR02118 family)
MTQMTVLYHTPTDPKHFHEYYYATHVPIAKRVPGLRQYTVSNGAVSAPDGSPAKYELVAQLSFDSADALKAAFGSPEGQAAVNDLANFATGGVTILVFETREV